MFHYITLLKTTHVRSSVAANSLLPVHCTLAEDAWIHMFFIPLARYGQSNSAVQATVHYRSTSAGANHGLIHMSTPSALTLLPQRSSDSTGSGEPAEHCALCIWRPAEVSARRQHELAVEHTRLHKSINAVTCVQQRSAGIARGLPLQLTPQATTSTQCSTTQWSGNDTVFITHNEEKISKQKYFTKASNQSS